MTVGGALMGLAVGSGGALLTFVALTAAIQLLDWHYRHYR